MPSPKMHKIYVPGCGPIDARIVAIGEAPWKSECYHVPPTPLVGPAGHKFDELLTEAGIDRESIRIENLVEYAPPGSKPDIETIDPEILIQWIYNLRRRLERLREATVFVPMGNYPTFALTGMGRVMPAVRNAFGVSKKEEVGITRLRGSVFSGPGGVKAIPTIHPSALLRHGHTRPMDSAVIADWKFIREQAGFPGIENRPLRVHPVDALHSAMLDPFVPLSIDIETWSGDIDCVGVAWSASDAVVIPTDTDEDLKRYLPLIRELGASPNAKIFQNGLFDTYWLARRWGIHCRNYRYDTLGMHHALDPILEHTLHFMASIYTFPRLNYWKDEAKDAKELRRYASTRQRVFEYNAKDVTATWEISIRLRKELEAIGKWEFYLRHYAALYNPLLKMMLRGMWVDTLMQNRLKIEREKECNNIRKRLASYAGCDLYAKKDFSPLLIERFLTETLKMRPFFRMRKKSFDSNALLHMQTREPQKAGPAIELILRHRTLAKEIQYLDRKWDWDGRIRCEYTYRTEAGRLSSRGNPMGKGLNLQNIKRGGDIRKTFIADPGHIMLFIDLSRVEDRFVQMYSGIWAGSDHMLNLARSRTIDTHALNARAIMDALGERGSMIDECFVAYSKGDKENPAYATFKGYRQKAKKVTHGVQRALGAKGLTERFFEDGLIIPVQLSQRMIDAYLTHNPEIKDFYFSCIEEMIKRDRALTNSWGRTIRWTHNRLDNALFRKAYSFLPQSDTADLMNQYGVIAVDGWLTENYDPSIAELLAQAHDEVILSVVPPVAYDVAKFVIDSLEREIFVLDEPISIPADLSYGTSWGGKIELGALPDREIFDQKVEKLIKGM